MVNRVLVSQRPVSIDYSGLSRRSAASGCPQRAVIKPATNGLHPSLTELQAVITIVSNILTEKQYEPMRPALAAAALQGVIDNAERLIHALQNKGEQAAGAGNGLFGVCPD
jgi:hypothetical protein